MLPASNDYVVLEINICEFQTGGKNSHGGKLEKTQQFFKNEETDDRLVRSP